MDEFLGASGEYPQPVLQQDRRRGLRPTTAPSTGVSSSCARGEFSAMVAKTSSIATAAIVAPVKIWSAGAGGSRLLAPARPRSLALAASRAMPAMQKCRAPRAFAQVIVQSSGDRLDTFWRWATEAYVNFRPEGGDRPGLLAARTEEIDAGRGVVCTATIKDDFRQHRCRIPSSFWREHTCGGVFGAWRLGFRRCGRRPICRRGPRRPLPGNGRHGLSQRARWRRGECSDGSVDVHRRLGKPSKTRRPNRGPAPAARERGRRPPADSRSLARACRAGRGGNPRTGRAAHHRAACRAMAVGCNARSSGGVGIDAWTNDSAPASKDTPAYYFQQFVAGQSCAAIYLAAAEQTRFVARPNRCCCLRTTRPGEFCYAGSLGPLLSESRRDATLASIGEVLAREFDLRGRLASITSTMASIYGRSRSILAIRRRSRFSSAPGRFRPWGGTSGRVEQGACRTSRCRIRASGTRNGSSTPNTTS